jgi:hypothetical protein
MDYPDVPQAWRHPLIGGEPMPVLTIDFRSPAGILRFFETITTFAAPLSVTLDDLRIDCTFPGMLLWTQSCTNLYTRPP